MTQQETEKKPPHILTDAGLNMFVNTVMLREVALPIIEIDIENLVWHFDMPVWAKDGTDDWNLTPLEVINKGTGTSVHQKRVVDADTTYPIIVTDYRSRLVILDGVHRLVKVYMGREKKIKAKIIPMEYLFRSEFQTK